MAEQRYGGHVIVPQEDGDGGWDYHVYKGEQLEPGKDRFLRTLPSYNSAFDYIDGRNDREEEIVVAQREAEAYDPADDAG